MYPYLPNGWNVGTIKNASHHVSGFMGYRVKQKIKDNLIFGVHDSGRGRIIYLADNPLFRGFGMAGNYFLVMPYLLWVVNRKQT